jgi:hypothetical protein
MVMTTTTAADIAEAARVAARRAADEKRQRNEERDALMERRALGNAILWAAFTERFVAAADAEVAERFGGGAIDLTLRESTFAARGAGGFDFAANRARRLDSAWACFDVAGPVRELFDDDVALELTFRWLSPSISWVCLHVGVPVVESRRHWFRRRQVRVGTRVHEVRSLEGLGALLETLEASHERT